MPEVLALDEPLSLWGGLDPRTGEIVDRRHPQCGAVVTGRVLVMPHGRGSSSAATVLAEAVRLGTAPAAIVLRRPDEILTVGAFVAAELYGVECPVVVWDEARYRAARHADVLVVPGAGGLAGAIREVKTPSKEPTVLTVADIMTRDVVTVTPETTLRQAAVTMLQHHISGLPVVDGGGALVGIVSEADFVDQEAVHDGAGRPRLLDVLFGRGEEALVSAETVGDIMSTDVRTVAPGTRVAEAARRMARGGKRLPVVDESGALVGIVSRADVLALYAREDDAIERDVDRLLRSDALPLHLDGIEIQVREGVVTLRGGVDARSDAEFVALVVGRQDGVIRVQNELEWEVDDRVPAQRYPGYPQEGSED